MATPDALSVIHSRKSVRHYLDTPVSKQDLEVLVKAAMAAPTAMDRRPWAFVIITEKKVLSALADVLPSGKMLASAGAAVAVCGVPEKEILTGKMREFWVQDCSAATENLLLAVEAKKLGAVWIGIYPDDGRIKAVQATLGIPAEIIPLNVVSIGYPVGDEKPKDKYDPSAIHWNKW